jgi:hypothetical protein
VDDYFAGSSSPQQPPAVPPQTWSAVPPPPPPPPPGVGYQPPPQAWPPPAPPTAWTYQPVQPGMSTGVKVLIGVAIGLGSIIIIGVLAAIAIPVFLNQRTQDLAAHTTVSMPPVAAGLALRTDAASEQLAQRLNVASMPGQHLAGAYGGTARPEVLVAITKHHMSPGDQRAYLAAAVRGARQVSPTALDFEDVDAGSLGGEVLCSSAPAVTVCFFVDAGAYGSAVVVGTPDRATQLVPQVRAAVERRS